MNLELVARFVSKVDDQSNRAALASKVSITDGSSTMELVRTLPVDTDYNRYPGKS